MLLLLQYLLFLSLTPLTQVTTVSHSQVVTIPAPPYLFLPVPPLLLLRCSGEVADPWW